MITVAAHAKLTVSLRVTGVRSDGYHLIDAEMVTLDLADQLTIATNGDTNGATNGRGLSVTGTYARGVPTDHTNLIARAMQLCGRNAAVHVDKNIPHGGGLGGGSADAAAVLRWSGFTDLGTAARLGADVPFCMVGGRAQVTGIGEIIVGLAHVQRTFTLIIPPLSCATAAVYAAWDELGGPTSDGANDLEQAALVVEPTLARWRDRIADATGTRPTLAGSGATWFVQGAHHGLNQLLPEAHVVITTTVDSATANGTNAA